jgi:murein DD-endopeptidase MepM/ murein hydrolase activator NlpD
MNENPKETGKFTRFFEEKGFYIILFLCIAAIGIAGYVLFFEPSAENDSAFVEEHGEEVQADTPTITFPGLTDTNKESTDTNDTVKKPAKEATTALTPSTEDVPTVEDAEDEPAINGEAVLKDAVAAIAESRPKTDAPAEAEPKSEPEPEKKSETTFFVRPVSGEVLNTFSGDELVYDRTMGDWRTHNGVDFEAADGTLVAAVADGVVEDVYRDEYYGTGVLIDHGDGLKSVYLGLIENATVSPGQEVSAGETIGAVTTASLFESLESAHLHLEMSVDGERVDPMGYIPE